MTTTSHGGIHEDQIVMTSLGPIPAKNLLPGARIISRNGASTQVMSVKRGPVQDMKAVITCDGVRVVVSSRQPWSVLVKRTHPAGSRAYVLHDTEEIQALLTQPCTIYLPTLTGPARMSEPEKNWMDAISSRYLSVFEVLLGSIDGEHVKIDLSDAGRVREAMWSLGGTAELRKNPSDSDHVILCLHTPYTLSPIPTRDEVIVPPSPTHPLRRVVSITDAEPSSPVVLELDAPESLISLQGFVLTGWAGVSEILPIND